MKKLMSMSLVLLAILTLNSCKPKVTVPETASLAESDLLDIKPEVVVPNEPESIKIQPENESTEKSITEEATNNLDSASPNQTSTNNKDAEKTNNDNTDTASSSDAYSVTFYHIEGYSEEVAITDAEQILYIDSVLSAKTPITDNLIEIPYMGSNCKLSIVKNDVETLYSFFGISPSYENEDGLMELSETDTYAIEINNNKAETYIVTENLFSYFFTNFNES